MSCGVASMESRRQRAFVAASVAGLLAAVGVCSAGRKAHAADEEPTSVRCYGVNKCQGVGDCGGKSHGCHGQNACKGLGFLSLSQDDCLRIEGGRLTESVEDTAEKVG